MLMLKWNGEGKPKHCPSCTAADGQIHPADVWASAGLLPRCEALICSAACTCTLDPVESDQEVGEIGDIPVNGSNTVTTLSAQLGGTSDQVNQSGEFEILAITAGKGNGWEFPEDVLRASLSLWEGVECFVNHSWEGRSIRDLAGMCQDPAWSDEAHGVRVNLRAMGPSAAVLDQLGREVLAAKGRKPKVGFSADVVFTADDKKRVTKIVRVNSLDLVYNPARGGAFVRALNQEAGSLQLTADSKERDRNMSENQGEYNVNTQLQDDLSAARNLLAVQQEKDKLTAEAEAARAVRAQMCAYLLDSGLAAAKLPAAMAEHVRKQFAGKVYEAAELDAAIQSARELVGQLTAASIVQGPGRIHGMFDSKDKLQAAVDDLFETPREKGSEGLSVSKLSGIRELYLMLTGDVDLHGGYDRSRIQLATTADFTGLVKNALNKIVINTWDVMGQAGYDWWTRIVQQEHFESLNTITGILVGTVGDLPAIAEGAEYTELAIGDSPETGTFQKYGGYVPLTLELIDRDNTRKLKAYAKELGNAGLRKISNLVAGIFTANSGVGPTMADTGALFNSTAVTTAGGHANLTTTALASAAWETVKTAVYNQPALIKNALGYYGSGPKLGIDAKYLLVPRALQLTAMQIVYPSMERASNIFTENMQRGAPNDVVTVPDWTDTNDWAAVCDPRILPAIYIGERFGIRPQIYVAGDDQSPAVFMNDESRLKVRHFLAVWVNDFRPLAKANVP